jgi:aspartate oxidase
VSIETDYLVIGTGIAAAIGPNDDIQKHYDDTMATGARLIQDPVHRQSSTKHANVFEP